MNRREALAGLPAALYAGTSVAQAASAAGYVRTTERVKIIYRDGALRVLPPIALLFSRRPDRPPSSLKWDIDIPRDHSLEINFAVDYEGEVHPSLRQETEFKRGPFGRAENETRGRYVTQGPATGENALDSGIVDVVVESYWKYEITVNGPDGQPVLVVDPGTIIKEGEI
jgi:hypothetical protein